MRTFLTITLAVAAVLAAAQADMQPGPVTGDNQLSYQKFNEKFGKKLADPEGTYQSMAKLRAEHPELRGHPVQKRRGDDDGSIHGDIQDGDDDDDGSEHSDEQDAARDALFRNRAAAQRPGLKRSGVKRAGAKRADDGNDDDSDKGAAAAEARSAIAKRQDDKEPAENPEQDGLAAVLRKRRGDDDGSIHGDIQDGDDDDDGSEHSDEQDAARDALFRNRAAAQRPGLKRSGVKRAGAKRADDGNQHGDPGNGDDSDKGDAAAEARDAFAKRQDGDEGDGPDTAAILRRSASNVGNARAASLAKRGGDDDGSRHGDDQDELRDQLRQAGKASVGKPNHSARAVFKRSLKKRFERDEDEDEGDNEGKHDDRVDKARDEARIKKLRHGGKGGKGGKSGKGGKGHVAERDVSSSSEAEPHKLGADAAAQILNQATAGAGSLKKRKHRESGDDDGNEHGDDQKPDKDEEDGDSDSDDD